MRDILRWVLHWFASPPVVVIPNLDVEVRDAAKYAVGIRDAAKHSIAIRDEVAIDVALADRTRGG